MTSRSLAAILLCASICLTATSALSQGTCNAPLTGQPCGYGGIATQGNHEPGLNLGVGNPINLATGNKHQHDVDLPRSSAWPLLEISRHYNAMDTRQSAFGPGWVSSYDTRLYQLGKTTQIVQADGSRVVFPFDASQNLTATASGTLARDGSGWTWRWPNGRSLAFDHHGYLMRISAGEASHQPASGDSLARAPSARPAAVAIQRHALGKLQGLIHRIDAGEGRALQFLYRIIDERPYVQHIDSPAGRFRYDYELAPQPDKPAQAVQHPQSPQPKASAARNASRLSASLRLTAVTRPDGMQRRYLYEETHQSGNPYHLTGIELRSADGKQAVRLGNWDYDASGKAVAFGIGATPHRTQFQVRYVRAATTHQHGITEIRDALGRVTRFDIGLHAGRNLVLRVDGQPCPGCAVPGSRASYDAAARLTAINGHRIMRYSNGSLKRLTPSADHGWPGLSLHYNPAGLRSGWETALTGNETARYTANGQLIQRRFANGDQWLYEYDAQDRPVRLVASNGLASQTTGLQWQNELLSGVIHPHESETRRHDQHKRLVERTIKRPAAAGWPAARYFDKFDYDTQHRLIRHHLPEGGVLHYQWGHGQQLLGIRWETPKGQHQTIIESLPGLAGYRYGNGLWLRSVAARDRTSILALHDGASPVWEHRQMPDKHNRIHHEIHQMPAVGHRESWSYAYDSHSRLSGALHHGESKKAALRLAWNAWRQDGSTAALRTASGTVQPSLQRDASGLPTSFSGHRLRYGPNRRLTSVQQIAADGRLLIDDHYLHNAFGHRIFARSREGSRQFFYVGSRLVAEGRLPNEAAADVGIDANSDAKNTPRLITRRYIHAHHVPVGMIHYTPDHPQGMLYAIHSDLVGAPRVVTDADKNIRWLATYTPMGRATRVKGDLSLSLRLPGQIHDESTGWHDNLLRTYLPRLGHYLEPDPLGPVPGSQALGYAGQQPRQYIDPTGLLLFAFDGTRNSAETLSNVWKLSQRYLDGPVFYHPGPGDPRQLDWDAITAFSAPGILETQWQSLLDSLGNNGHQIANDTVPIDIIGFSRGAALGRHFGNQINQHVVNGRFSFNDPMRGLITACVDLRFMGLFDTVAQFGLAGAHNANYDLTIAAAWGWVAHAVALQERRWLFPLSSAADSATPNTIEAPFIGAHADIGGGIAYSDTHDRIQHGDLSDVALNWMLWQARAASLQFGAGGAGQSEVTLPVLHDDRSSLARSIQEGDRRIDGASGAKQFDYQDEHERLGRRQRDITETLIARYDDWRGTASRAVGQVNMDGYAQWLYDELGWKAVPH